MPNLGSVSLKRFTSENKTNKHIRRSYKRLDDDDDDLQSRRLQLNEMSSFTFQMNQYHHQQTFL